MEEINKILQAIEGLQRVEDGPEQSTRPRIVATLIQHESSDTETQSKEENQINKIIN